MVAAGALGLTRQAPQVADRLPPLLVTDGTLAAAQRGRSGGRWLAGEYGPALPEVREPWRQPALVADDADWRALGTDAGASDKPGGEPLRWVERQVTASEPAALEASALPATASAGQPVLATDLILAQPETATSAQPDVRRTTARTALAAVARRLSSAGWGRRWPCWSGRASCGPGSRRLGSHPPSGPTARSWPDPPARPSSPRCARRSWRHHRAPQYEPNSCGGSDPASKPGRRWRSHGGAQPAPLSRSRLGRRGGEVEVGLAGATPETAAEAESRAAQHALPAVATVELPGSGRRCGRTAGDHPGGRCAWACHSGPHADGLERWWRWVWSFGR